MVALLLAIAGLLILLGARDLGVKALNAAIGLAIALTFAPTALAWLTHDPAIRAGLCIVVALVVVAGGVLLAAHRLAQKDAPQLPRAGTRSRAHLVEPEKWDTGRAPEKASRTGDDLNLFGGRS